MTTLSRARRFDPFSDFDALVRQAFSPRAFASPGFVPAAEVSKDEDDAVVRIELPGVDVDNDVTVEIDAGRLIVRGKRQDDRESEQDGRTLREFRYGEFRRAFSLPRHVTTDAVSASYDAGVLTVRVSGAYAGTDAQRIAITTSETPAVEAN